MTFVKVKWDDAQNLFLPWCWRAPRGCWVWSLPSSTNRPLWSPVHSLCISSRHQLSSCFIWLIIAASLLKRELHCIHLGASIFHYELSLCTSFPCLSSILNTESITEIYCFGHINIWKNDRQAEKMHIFPSSFLFHFHPSITPCSHPCKSVSYDVS